MTFNMAVRAGAAALVVGLLGACGGDIAKTGESRKLAVRYTLAHACLAIGEKQTATARTETNAELAFVTQYADRLIHGEAPKGFTDKHGVFKRSWTIPSDAPAGRADLRIIGAKGPKSANLVTTFDVVPGGATCP